MGETQKVGKREGEWAGEASIYDLLLTSHIKSIRDPKRSRHAHDDATAGCLALYRSLSLVFALAAAFAVPFFAASYGMFGAISDGR